LAQFEPKQKGALLLRFFQNLALVRGTFWPKLVAHFEPFYPSLIDNKLVPGQWPYVDKKFTNRENATHYIATRWGQLR